MSDADEGQTPVWQRLDQLSDAELRNLTEAAISVLWEQTPDPPVQSPMQLPRGVLTAQLGEVLGDQSTANRVTSDVAMSRAASIAVLAEIGAQPVVADEIEAAYRARQDMMVVDVGVMLAGALILAVLKLRRVKVEKGNVEVDFYKAQSGVLDAVRRLFGG